MKKILNDNPTHNDLKPYYDTLLKNDSYRGDVWFAHKSTEFKASWEACEDKQALLDIANNHQDLAMFIAHCYQQSGLEVINKTTDLQAWSSRRVAALNDHSPRECARAAGSKRQALKHVLQQIVEKVYLPRWQESKGEKEKEAAFSAKLKDRLVRSNRSLISGTYVGFQSTNIDPALFIVYRQYWEIWHTERGRIDLLFYTGDQDELLNTILNRYVRGMD